MDPYQGLLALAAAQDDEPYIPSEEADWFDTFDMGEDDILNDMLESGDLEAELLEDIGGEDMIELFDAFAMDDINVERYGRTIDSYVHHDRIGIPAGKRELPSMPVYQRLDINREITLYSLADEGSVHITDGVNTIVVGRTRQKTVFSYVITRAPYYELANMFAEEVGGTGTNMGFSAFFHNATTLMLARNISGVVESMDGADFATDGVTFEITGKNWQSRTTKRDVVLSKYLINNAILYAEPHHDDYNRWSWNEDNRIITSFYETAFDYESTARSEIVAQIARRLPLITDRQRSAIGKAYITYQSERPLIQAESILPNLDFSETAKLVDECIASGAKTRNDGLFVPSPFRVLYPQDDPIVLTCAMIDQRYATQVRTTDYIESTYHTWSIADDPQHVLESTLQRYPQHEMREAVSIQHSLFFHHMRYKSFMHAYIQSNLLPKIHGKGGWFYDIYCRTGISWYRTTRNALTWTCCYYMFSHPGPSEEVGIWSHHPERGLYVGPNFKISRQDIHYASVLPTKIHSMIAAVRPLLSPREYGNLEPRLMSLTGGLSNSSWMTSFRSGANRFITCCHLSSSGNVPSLIKGQLGRERKHRFPDFYILSKMRNYCASQGSRDLTPFWQLPFALCSLEKDYSQMMQWHMRATDHDTQCMVKVSQAAIRHNDEYQETVEFMAKQCKWLDDMMVKGLSYYEFKNILDSTPAFPVFNIFTFIAMCNIARDEIQSLGASQHAMGFTIWKMMTDRHCTAFNYDPLTNRPVLTATKVVDAMSSYLRSLGKLTGPYELIAKMAQGPKLPPNYLLNHAKDAKESDREISQQFPEHRIKQCFPEVLVETFTGNNETDQMSDSAKYDKHVTDTMTICNLGRAVHASEDRSKFCQEQEPQMQALGLACISLEGNSTALASAAAMTLMNKTRRIVYPPKADIEMLTGELEKEIVFLNHNKRREITAAITIEKNMTQGLGAITAGAINTIYVAAQDNIISQISPGIIQGTRRTTSDDVKRSANISATHDYLQQSAIFYKAPNLDLHKTMMVDNEKKPIFSSRFSEFNNVIATKTGMVPQSPIYATLAVQPLLSKSCFGDLVDAIGAARSTLSWGCPPDVMDAALYGMLRTFQQKWLLSDDDMDALIAAGMIPTDMSELISGFWIRNDNMLKIVFSLFDEEQRQAILRGEVPLYKMLKRIELTSSRKKRKPRIVHKPIDGLYRANAVAESIYSQRMAAESLLSRHVQPISYNARIAARIRFMAVVGKETPDVDITELKKLAPPRVATHNRAARRVDRLPTSLGTSGLIPTESLQRIRAHRHLNINYRDYPTEAERQVSVMQEEDYLKHVAIMERTKHYQGLSFKSPSGRPLTRTYDAMFFYRPAVFDFTVELSQLPHRNTPFTYRGIRVSKFKPIIWGSNLLDRITGKNDRLAFGHGEMNENKVIFYQLKGRNAEIQATTVRNTDRGVHRLHISGLYINYTMYPDFSPLLIHHHQSPTRSYLPGIVGDNNAVLNYGMYCRSNNNQGFCVYRSMFYQYKSAIPYFVQRSMPPYPTFMRNPVQIPQARMTVLNGYSAIPYLKLTLVEHPVPVVKINLNGERPTIEVEQVIEYDCDLDWAEDSDSEQD